uniref:Uncharacterized protein n=1 Tax=Plectus sambesii TaxID=2011161 RepID=A0A914W5W6_9BILA
MDELTPRHFVNIHECYAGRITRSLAEVLVLQSHLPSGSFLIRESLSDMSGKFYALTVKDEDGCPGGKAKHYRIERNDINSEFTIIVKPFGIKFKSLEKLIQHFSCYTGLLCCMLTYPALRNTLVLPTELPKRVQNWLQNGGSSYKKLIEAPKTNTGKEVTLAIETAVETVRAPLREALSCTICCEVSREPTLCVTCGQVVGCFSCVLTALEHDERCPLCRAAWSRSRLAGFIKSRMNFENVLGL